MRVLVTGGAGYVGSHVAKALAGAGFEPVVLDDLSAGHRWAVRWGPLVVGDLADRAPLERIFGGQRVEAVVHLAASAEVGESMRAPGKYFRNNVTAGFNLLDAMVEHGVRQLVFSSTCAVYGMPRSLPMAEGHPRDPVSPYGESKLMLERALRWYGRAHGLRWAALRYFNAAGADPDGELGEVHEPEGHLLPVALLAALGERPRLEVFGTDYPTADGTAVRDYVHVTDLAAAHVRALRHLLDGGEGGAFNLGTGEGRSVRQVIAAVEAAVGRPVPAREAPRRAGDPPTLVADARRAAEVLGWRPHRSDLQTLAATAREGLKHRRRR